MLTNTQGIVLHRFKFSENSLIVPIFTKQFGRQSYLIYGLSNKNARQKANLIQPLHVLDLQVYQKENRDLQKLKDYGIARALPNIHTDFAKSSIALFVSEFLYRSLRENESDTELYDYLIFAINTLNSAENSVGNLHLSILLKLTRFFGITPEENYSESAQIFDMQNARFNIVPPNHSNYCTLEISQKLYELMHTPLEESYKVKLTKNQRSILMNSLLDFYNLHIDRPGKLKSVEVLQSVFV